jgi:hypothetical protein
MSHTGLAPGAGNGQCVIGRVAGLPEIGEAELANVTLEVGLEDVTSI